MDVWSAVTALFPGWSSKQIRILRGRDGAVLVSLGKGMVGSSPTRGGNVAGIILDILAGHRGLSVTTEDDGRPSWQHLLSGGNVVVTSVRSWEWIKTDPLPNVVTVAVLADSTGLPRNTIRDKLRIWVQNGSLIPISRFGPHGARSYPLDQVRTLIRDGNRTSHKARHRRTQENK